MKTEDAANRFLSNLPTLRRHRRVAARRSRLQSPARPTLNGRFFLGSVEKINYPGIGNYSAVAYEALGLISQIVEVSGGSSTASKNFVNCDVERCEERNDSSSAVDKFFAYGENSGVALYYALDHLDSTREVVTASGVTVGEFSFDLFGRRDNIIGSEMPSNQFGHYYLHSASGLNLTQRRAYSASLGRWLNRDPIEETSSVNLFLYCRNAPTLLIDPSGLFHFDPKICCQIRSKLKELSETSKQKYKEMGIAFNISSNGKVNFGERQTGLSESGPIYAEPGYANVGMTHVLGAKGWQTQVMGIPVGIPKGLGTPTGPNSGFSTQKGDFLPKKYTRWAINDSGNLFAIENGNLYEMSADCKSCWDRGPNGNIASGIKPCP